MLDRTGSALRDFRTDTQPGTALRGLVHDLGHGLATLSCLVDGMSDDPELPLDARHRAELMEQQLDMLRRTLDQREPRPGRPAIDVRELVARIAAATALSTSAWVALRPGEAVELCMEQAALWRMVTNVVDNAVRAAGPRGTVELSVERGESNSVCVEIADDGPGFGSGPHGVSGYGLGVVRALAAECGAWVLVRAAAQRGTLVRLVFPGSTVAWPKWTGET